MPADPDFAPITFDRPNAIDDSVVRHRQIQKETGMVMIGYPGVIAVYAEDIKNYRNRPYDADPISILDLI